MYYLSIPLSHDLSTKKYMTGGMIFNDQEKKINQEKDKVQVAPFLRWAGGKRFLVNRFRPFVPRDLEHRVYHEPFVGSGSLFFALQPEES
jgi:D12 class N6 adenine-specific DNA methyltransferase